MSGFGSSCGSCNSCAPQETQQQPHPAPEAPAFAALTPLPEMPIAKKESEARGDYSPPHRLPFLIGVYLAINAVPDAAVIVDGPDCLFFKTEHVHGKHDLRSTLLDVGGRHRVVVSHVYADNIAMSRGEKVRSRLEELDARTSTNIILISSLPMVTVIGTHYDQIIRDLQPHVAAQLIECPGRSLAADWLGGYTDVLQSLATHLPLTGSPTPGKVAIIGNFHHRNEEDCLGNVRELERLVGALGLECTPTWLSGAPSTGLARAGEAELLIALPQGRKAAQILAARTGARVLEVDAPFGLGRTRRFLLSLARATDRLPQAQAFISAELRSIVPRLEWMVPHVFLGKRVAFEGTPDLLPGFLQLAAELGMEVVHLSSPSERPEWLDDLDEFGAVPPLFFGVSTIELTREFLRLSRYGLDLLVGSTTALRQWGWSTPYVEFGYPSYTDHALFDRPYLGFRGYLSFVERMASAIAGRMHIEVLPPGAVASME